MSIDPSRRSRTFLSNRNFMIILLFTVSVVLEYLFSPPFLRPFAREHQAARVDAEVDVQLGERYGRAVPLQDREFPPQFAQALLEEGLEPEDVGASEGDHLRAVLLDRRHRFR